MPAYDYQCPACNTIEERFVSYSERNDQTCLECSDTLNLAWVKSQAPVIFREDNYQIEAGSREGVHCASKRQLLDQIKYANDSNPNPYTITSEFYG
jgi:putative FmdB family regulatory protein